MIEVHGSNYKHRSYKASKQHAGGPRASWLIAGAPCTNTPSPYTWGKQLLQATCSPLSWQMNAHIINKRDFDSKLFPSSGKQTGLDASDSSGRCTVSHAPVGGGSCLCPPLMTAKQSSGQPSHHANYVCCVSSVSGALIKPPGSADQDGLSTERCQYATTTTTSS